MSTTALLQAAGFVQPVSIAEDNGWNLIEVRSRDLFSPPHLVLLFQSRANWTTVEAARNATRDLQGNRSLHIIVQKSCAALAGTEARVKLRKELNAADVFTNQELLSVAAKRAFAGRPADTELYFIDPYLADSTGQEEPALDLLGRWLRDDKSSTHVAVVIAPAGVGKTTVARQLNYRLQTAASDLRIPLLVESQQWASLPITALTLSDLWKTAFEHNYSHFVPEEEFQAFVQNGCLVPIFDGFDELCTRRNHDFDPMATLEALRSLAATEEARLILTTREAFWSELPNEARVGCHELVLQQFNGQQVDRYIEKRFAHPPQFGRREIAKRIIQRLQTEAYPADSQKLPKYETRLWSLPLVVYLVCESADSDDSGESRYGNLLPSSPLTAIFLMLCERERARRQLEIAPEKQMSFFRDIAAELDRVFSAGDLEAVCDVCDIPREQRELLHAHALLTKIENSWTFRFDFLRDYLRAELLREILENGDRPASVLQLTRLLASEANGQGPALEHYARVLASAENPWEAKLSAAWNLMAQPSPSGVARLQLRSARSALLHLGNAMAETSERERSARTKVMERVFGDALFRKAYVEGPVVGLDLGGRRFEDTEFNNSGFRNCAFDRKTTFATCRFVGTFEASGCDGLSQAVILSCDFSTEARELFLTLMGSDRPEITRAHIVEVLAGLLANFWAHGRFKTRTEEDVRRSAFCRSPLGNELLDELCRDGTIYRHTISGVGRDAGLAVDKEAMREVRAFFDHRLIGRRLLPLVDRLEKRWSEKK